MAKKPKVVRPTPFGRRLLHEMARDGRVILLQKDARRWMGLQYVINSFPMRLVRPAVVAALAQNGYLTLDRRGYYILTTLGQLEGAVAEVTKVKREKKKRRNLWL